MADRVINEGRSFKGSSVYLTRSEKEALKRAIDMYTDAVTYASDRAFIDFYIKHDEKALESAYKKMR